MGLKVSQEALREALREVMQETFAPVARIKQLKEKPLLNTAEAAELYGIGKGTLEKRRMRGLPPAHHKVGGVVFYTHEGIKDCINKGLVKVRQ